MSKQTDFQTFWNTYALKRDRIAAERAWNRLSEKDKQAALAGIATYSDYCERHGICLMYAQGYLNHRRWEDEPEPVPCPAVSPQENSFHTAQALADMELF